MANYLLSPAVATMLTFSSTNEDSGVQYTSSILLSITARGDHNEWLEVDDKLSVNVSYRGKQENTLRRDTTQPLVGGVENNNCCVV